jgi:hypothetical protein
VPGRRAGAVEHAEVARRQRGVRERASLDGGSGAGAAPGGEVGPGLGAAQRDGGAVVCHGRIDGRVVGAQPHARLPPGVADLRRVPAPRPLPDAAVVRLHALLVRYPDSNASDCEASSSRPTVPDSATVPAASSSSHVPLHLLHPHRTLSRGWPGRGQLFRWSRQRQRLSGGSSSNSRFILLAWSPRLSTSSSPLARWRWTFTNGRTS